MDVAFPYRFDLAGRTAAADLDRHVRDLIEQVLFTAPGERVNRPTFGSGVMQLVFAPNSEELAATTQYLVQGALQQWLGDRIEVDQVVVHAVESTLEVTVVYTVRVTRQQQSVRFARAGVSP